MVSDEIWLSTQYIGEQANVVAVKEMRWEFGDCNKGKNSFTLQSGWSILPGKRQELQQNWRVLNVQFSGQLQTFDFLGIWPEASFIGSSCTKFLGKHGNY